MIQMVFHSIETFRNGICSDFPVFLIIVIFPSKDRLVELVYFILPRIFD